MYMLDHTFVFNYNYVFMFSTVVTMITKVISALNMDLYYYKLMIAICKLYVRV